MGCFSTAATECGSKARRGWLHHITIVVLFCLSAGLTASAQVAGTAAVTGTVTDPTGAFVPDATVTISSPASGITRTAKTDAQGRFILTQLPPGTYRLEVTKSGFRKAVTEKQELLVGITTVLAFELELGQVTEQVVVQEAGIGINTTDASIGAPLSGTEVKALPSLDLNPAGLLSLQAGVAFIPSQADNPGGYGGVNDADGRSGAVNGARSDQSNITLDGVDCNDPTKGYAFNCVLRATSASLAEFRTTTTNYGAEAGGRSSGAQVQLVTRKGSNELHGEAYYSHRNEVFNANDWFLNKSGIEEPKFRRHIYGAALGGPIIKNRFYLFGNFERLEESLFQNVLRDIPALSFRDGVFIYPCADVAGFANCPDTATTVTGLSGTVYNVEAGRRGLSPAEVAALDPLGIGANATLLAYWAGYPDPTPGESGTFDGINVVGHRFGAGIDNTFMTYIARADFNIDTAGNHTVFWRGTLHDDTVSTSPQFAGQEPNQRLLNNNKGFSAGYTAVLSPTWVNNFRYGLTRISEQTAGHQSQNYVDIRFLDEVTDVFSDTFGRTIPQHHLRDDMTLVRGNHTLSFGGEARFTRNQKFNNQNSFHFYSVNPSWTQDGGGSVTPGDAFCDRAVCNTFPSNDGNFEPFILLLGMITEVDASYNYNADGSVLGTGDPVARRFAVNEYEFYLQDQWKMTPTFTLTYGVRYQVASPPWETNGNQVSPTPDLGDYFRCRARAMRAGLPSGSCGLLTTDLSGPENNGPDFYNTDYNNWSPRLAFAWSPNYSGGILGSIFGEGKMSIRAGYSLVYERMGNALINSFDELGSFGLSSQITSQFGGCGSGAPNPPRPTCVRFSGQFDTNPADTIAPGLPAAPPASFPATPPSDLLAVSSSLDSNIVTPWAQTFNASVSRELPWNLTVEAAYVGRRGSRLPLIRDYAMPADFCDPISGMCAFEAARLLIAADATGVALADIGTIPFWENVVPGFGPTGINGGCLQFGRLGSGCGFTATQVAYDYMIGYHRRADRNVPGFGASTFWQDLDYFAFPAYATCSSGTDLDGIDAFDDCPYTFFIPQFVNLGAWSTVGRSHYDALQLMVRRRMSSGLMFALNYTLSESMDHSSSPERASTGDSFFVGGPTGYALNSWEIEREYANSDFDIRHQINAHWIWELPFGRGKRWGADIPGVVDQILGGWQISGIFRFNTGVPANIWGGRTWPTNWNFSVNAQCKPAAAPKTGIDNGPCPDTQNAHFATHSSTGAVNPNLFADPDAALDFFRFSAVGERGQRNVIRADGYSSINLGIAKSFSMPLEGHRLTFRWDIFNLTNTPYFEATSLNASLRDANTFGDYTAMLGGPRRMQIGLRYEF